MSSPDLSHTHFCPYASLQVTTDLVTDNCNVVIIIIIMQAVTTTMAGKQIRAQLRRRSWRWHGRMPCRQRAGGRDSDGAAVAARGTQVLVAAGTACAAAV